jgi:ABC-2 type transport system ATP-binding protein
MTRTVRLAHDDGPTVTPPRLSAMNVVHTQAISPAPGAARWATAFGGPPGGGFHNFGIVLLALLAIGGLSYSVTRSRRGRHGAQHDDQWIRPEPPPTVLPSSPPPSTPSEPPAGTTLSTASTAVAPTRASRAASAERPAGGWAVEARGLMKRFGSTVAVDGVDLRVPRGSAFGYLGPNGAGKTTLIRTLLGLTRADGGTMSLLGLPVPAQRKQALAGVGAIVDEPRFHSHLTGRDNLRLLAAARGGDASQRIDASLDRVGLSQRAGDKVASYSMGMRQRLGVAACLLGEPELLILDEPMNGLDPAGMHEMRAMITSLVDEGRTVVLSSHLLDEVERTCDAVAIVDRGRVIRQGALDELTRGAGAVVVQVDCADPARAGQLIDQAGIAVATALADDGLTITLPSGTSRELVADINRRLVAAGISVYGLREIQTSLEDWFLSVTSRLGEKS